MCTFRYFHEENYLSSWLGSCLIMYILNAFERNYFMLISFFSLLLTECIEAKFGRAVERLYKDRVVKFFRYKSDYRHKKNSKYSF